MLYKYYYTVGAAECWFKSSKYKSLFPEQLEWNKIFVPSGEKTGFEPSSGLDVKRICTEDGD